MQAAEAVAAQLGLRRPRPAAADKGGRPGAAKKQRQLTLLPAAGDVPGSAPSRQQQQQQQAQPPAFQRQRVQPVDSSMCDAGPRPQERDLLAQLYPAAADAGGQGPAAGAAPRQTPQLGGRRTLSRTADVLWSGAGACTARAPTLGARLAQREAEDPDGAAARKQPLARGGTAYPAAEESRALKRVKLEALREELRMHESTVADLRRMIAGLEREVEGG